MKLITIQPLEVAERLTQGLPYICDGNLSKLVSMDEFREAYIWLGKAMDARMGTNPETRPTYPVWAWHSIRGVQAQLDRRMEMLRHNPESALIQCSIDDSRVMLSDYDDWHAVLNRMPHLDDETWEHFEEIGDDPFIWPQQRIENTWQGVLHDRGPYTQACFWQLNPDDVVEIRWPNK